MIVFFDNQECLTKAIKVGHKAGICDCEDFTVDAAQNAIIFDDTCEVEITEFISALEENNNSSEELIYFRARY